MIQVYATIQEYDGQGYFIQRKKKKGWAGWQPSNEDAKIECEKNVMGKREDDNKDITPQNLKRPNHSSHCFS